MNDDTKKAADELVEEHNRASDGYRVHCESEYFIECAIVTVKAQIEVAKKLVLPIKVSEHRSNCLDFIDELKDIQSHLEARL